MSKAIATTRSIERTSARNIRTVDVGALSSAKTQLTLTQTSGRTQARFAKRGSGFCLGAVTEGSAVASRRLRGPAHRGPHTVGDQGIRFGAPVAPAVGRGFARDTSCTGQL